MTVIEVLDKSSVENLYAPLSYSARRVIYIGRDAKETERECRVYRALFAARGMKTEVEAVTVTPGSGRELEMLTALFARSDSYLVDLVGGDETLLFLLGRAIEIAKPQHALVHYGSMTTHRFLPAGQAEMPPAGHKQPLPLHSPELRGHGTAFHPEIIGQLLPVVGDVKAAAPGTPGLPLQIGHQLFAGGAAGQQLDFAVEAFVLLRQQPHQIANQTVMLAASLRAGGQQPLTG